MLKGSLKSRTMWVAVIIGLISDIAPILTPSTLATLGLDPVTVQKVGVLLSIVMVICRRVTTQSLAEKGSQPTLPPPVDQPK